MAFITGIVDVQDANGNSIVQATGPNATRSPLVLKMSSTISASFAQSGDQGIVSLGVVTPPLPTFSTVSTVDATSTPIATLPAIPVGGSVYFTCVVMAVLGPGQVNANIAPQVWGGSVVVARTGNGAPSSIFQSFSGQRAPFVAALAGTTHGTVDFSFSGNSPVASAVGFTVKEAWTSGHTYTTGDGNSTPGDFVTAGGNVYLCTTSGTASGSAPSGTGTGLGTGAVFAYIAPASGSQVPVNWLFVITAMGTAS